VPERFFTVIDVSGSACPIARPYRRECARPQSEALADRYRFAVAEEARALAGACR